MSLKSLDISVIICAYTEERWKDTQDAIASVRRQTLPPREIILVIDHNPPLLERARTTFQDVIIVANSQPRGLSGARNSGLKVAQGDLIAFLDDDAIAEPTWLEFLGQHFEDAEIMGVGGKVEPEWLSTPPKWFPAEFYWVLGCTYRGMPDKTVTVRNPYGGCTCIRREVFEEVGGFRNGIGRIGNRPLGCEETELGIRAHQRWPQRRFLYEPTARIHHRIPAARGRFQYFRSRCYAEGLSKAMVSRLVGAQDGLSSERSYTLRVLPLAVLRGLGDALFRRDWSGPGRAGAVVAGLGFTTWGYLVGTISQKRAARKGQSSLNLHGPVFQLPARQLADVN